MGLLRFTEKRIDNIHSAAHVLIFLTGLSFIFSLVRDKLFAFEFGAGRVLDIYFSAFTITDILFIFITIFISAYTLVPFYEKKNLLGNDELKKFINNIFSVLAIVLLIGIVIFYIFLPYISPFILSGFSSEELTLSISLSRILLIQVGLLVLSSFFASITQMRSRFIIIGILPILYNVSIILGVLYLYPIFGIKGIVYGTVIGAFLHLLIQLPTISYDKLIPKLTIPKVLTKEFYSFIRISSSRAISLLSHTIIFLVFVNIASQVAEGSITIMTFAINIGLIPLSIIGVPYATSMFAKLSKTYANSDNEGFLEFLISGIKHSLFFVIPLLIFLIFLSEEITIILLGDGAFTQTSVIVTAAAISAIAIAAFFQTLILLFTRAYYAAQKVLIPMIAHTSVLSLAIILAYSFSSLFASSPAFAENLSTLFGIENLVQNAPLNMISSYAIASFVGALVFIFSVRKSFPFLKDRFKCSIFTRSIIENIIASIVASVAISYVVATYLSFSTPFIYSLLLFSFLAILWLFMWILVLKILSNREIDTVINTIKKKIWRI